MKGLILLSKTEKAISQMEAWAADNSHGYDQTYRWGQKGDFDCSAAVIQAWENAGVPVKSGGATYTGNMRNVFLRNGFKDVTASINLVTGAGLVRGDVLLHEQKHTAMYCGGGKEVEASINEHGTVTGGTPGDQTGKEFLVRAYRNLPWQCVLRYAGDESADTAQNATKAAESAFSVKCSTYLPLVKQGHKGQPVKAVQALLKLRGYSVAVDGDFGADTDAKVKAFQSKNKLDADGEVGKDTWKALIG